MSFNYKGSRSCSLSSKIPRSKISSFDSVFSCQNYKNLKNKLFGESFHFNDINTSHKNYLDNKRDTNDDISDNNHCGSKNNNEKPKKKGFCYKAPSNNEEETPTLSNPSYPRLKSDDDFVSRLEYLINQNITETKKLYEQRIAKSPNDLEVLEVLSKHLRNMESALYTIYEFRVHPATFFDLLLSNQVMVGKMTGNYSNGHDEDSRFRLDNRSVLKHESNGITIIRGEGKLFFGNKLPSSDKSIYKTETANMSVSDSKSIF